MAYNNNYNSNRNFNNGGYNRQNSGGNGGNSNGYNRQSSGKKKSGAKFKVKDANGNPCTTGWKVSRRFGFVKFLCVVTSKSVESQNKAGTNSYISVMVKVQKEMCNEEITNGLMNIHTGQVVIEKMGIVINPRAANGGYCGKFGKK